MQCLKYEKCLGRKNNNHMQCIKYEKCVRL